jgi:hypothetical protein
MAMDVSPPGPPPVAPSSQQLPLPLPLGPPLSPPPARPPVAEVVGPQQVWPHLAPPARARVRQAFARVLQEVLRDGVRAQR